MQSYLIIPFSPDPEKNISEVVLPLKLPNLFFPKTFRSRKRSRPPNVPRVCQVKASRRYLAINWQPRIPGRPGKSGRLDEMLLKMSKIEILMLSLISPQIDGIYIIIMLHHLKISFPLKTVGYSSHFGSLERLTLV